MVALLRHPNGPDVCAAASVDVACRFTIDKELPTGLIPHVATDASTSCLPPDLDAFVIDGVLSEKECEDLITAAEAAELTFWDTTRKNPRTDYRNADTVEITNPQLAGILCVPISLDF